MAGFFPRRSLAQDEVDRYTTWASMLFLLLALITLLMPLSPTLSSRSQSSESVAAAAPLQTSNPPEVKATCWTPAQFEQSQVDYTTEFCTGVANGVLNGIKPNGALVPFSDSPPPSIDPPQSNDDKLNLTSFDATLKSYFQTRDEQNAQQAENERIREKTRELVDFRTPIIFVLLALCLKLPYIFASLAASVMTSGVNIDQALDNCVASRSLDIASQRQVHEETAAAVADSLHGSKSAGSSLYLFTKVLVVLVVITETVFIGKYLLPDIQDMEVGFVDSTLPESAESFANMSNASKELFAYPNNVFQCAFTIRYLQNIRPYVAQCIITYLENSDEEPYEIGIGRTSPPTASHIKETLLLYQALFTVAMAVLAFLLIVTAINTVSWFLRLFLTSYATSLGLPSNAARDVVLFVYMARINAGPLVAQGVAGSSVWSNGFQETIEEPSMESRA